jgi:hypothetical protein
MTIAPLGKLGGLVLTITAVALLLVSAFFRLDAEVPMLVCVGLVARLMPSLVQPRLGTVPSCPRLSGHDDGFVL